MAEKESGLNSNSINDTYNIKWTSSTLVELCVVLLLTCKVRAHCLGMQWCVRPTSCPFSSRALERISKMRSDFDNRIKSLSSIFFFLCSRSRPCLLLELKSCVGCVDLDLLDNSRQEPEAISATRGELFLERSSMWT